MRINILFFCCCISVTAFGQDPTLSQAIQNLQLINPAATGLIAGTESVRLTGYSRSQWTPLSQNAYYTTGAMVDGRKCLSKGTFALGAHVQQDGAKLGRWSHLSAHIATSYHQPIHRKQFLAAGFYAGFLQNSLSANGLKFDQQFGANGYDPTAGIGESLNQNTPLRFDLHAGLMVYEIERQWIFGIALHHVNQPEYTFFESTQNDLLNRLDMGFTMHGSFTFAPVERIRQHKHWKYNVMFKKQSTSLVGHNLVNRQSQQWQLLAGMQTQRWLGASGGLGLRFSGRSPKYLLADACVIQGNWVVSGLRVGISYDLNLSRLLAATRHGGSFELTLGYQFNTYRKCITCPG